MAAPAAQMYTNAGKMKIFVDIIPNYVAYNLYSDTAVGMGAESLVGTFRNIVDGMYSSKHAMYQFNRPVAEGVSYYLRLKGVLPSGSEDTGNPGPVKYVPAVSENLPLYKPVIIEGFDGNVYRPVKVDTAGQIITSP
jgi:hypothetical protein